MGLVKFTNGNVLHIEESGGYKIYSIVKKDKPIVWLEGHCYKFAKNMVYRVKIELIKEKLV